MDLYKHSDILKAVVLSSEDAIVSKNLDGTITSWNPAAEMIFGFSESEAVGNNISIIIPTELKNEEKQIISRIKNGERIEHYETTRRRKDGSRFLAGITISPIKDKNDNIIGASKIARDITEQKRSEQQQALLAAIVDSSDDAIISKDLNGIIKSWNKGAEKILGYTAKEILGQNISIIIPASKIEEEAKIIKAIRSGKRLTHIETIRNRKDGREINLSLTISPVKDKDGKVIGASKIARDITKKVEIERERELYTKRLQEINQYKDEFMAMASHELKTPLTIIHANLQVLQHTMRYDENNEFVNKALQQVDKLSNLILDLLDVSKIRTGKLLLNFTDFDINLLVRNVIETLNHISLDHEIIFKTNKKQLLVRADMDRLEHVIINILTNAIKYSPGAKRIVVGTEIKDNHVLVKVKDLGIGIPPEDLLKIFGRFFRVRGLASTFSGSGVGLYISSEIIKRHGGNMWAKSNLGKGSTFYFTIPFN
ncbi:MAG: PAS domain S-box protein [Ginsengibacter sp.]